MDKSKKGIESFQTRLRNVNNIILRVRSRGIQNIDDLTLGEIMDIEQYASERDQIANACSAQSSAMLPKQTKSINFGIAGMQSAINRLVSRGDY